MDQTTIAVKNMYEQYPYPSGVPNMRAGFDVRLLLSYVKKFPAKQKTLHALDAGCGRGLGLIGAATLQRDITFVGADINTVALADAQQNASTRGLNNISFVQADLMTLEGIEVPTGGFDVIYSSGVLHHLTDPQTGLENLRKILAPHGIISLMVYGTFGRQPLYRLIDAIESLAPREQSIGDRMPAARLLTQVAEQTIFKGNYWEGTAQVNDVEFVDRCLNVNEISYDVASLWQLLNNVGMKFVRWTDADNWNIAKLFPEQQLQTRINSLEKLEQYQIIERLFERPRLELIICKDSNEKRAPATDQQLDNSFFSVNPEVSFLVEKRNLNQAQRIETLNYKLQNKEMQPVTDPLFSQAILLLVDQTTSFKGKEMRQALMEKGADRPTAELILNQLLAEEIIYPPH